MKTRKRLLVGLSLLAATFLFTLQDGVIGHLMAQFLGYLFGQRGAAVAAVLMLTAGTMLVVPPGAIARFFRWTTHGREARVDRVVAEMDEDMIERRIERAVARALKAKPVALENVVSGEILAPADRRQLDAVRDALRSLQYKKHEYEPLVQAMNPSRPFDDLVKGALKKLNEKRN